MGEWCWLPVLLKWLLPWTHACTDRHTFKHMSNAAMVCELLLQLSHEQQVNTNLEPRRRSTYFEKAATNPATRSTKTTLAPVVAAIQRQQRRDCCSSWLHQRALGQDVAKRCHQPAKTKERVACPAAELHSAISVQATYY